MADDLNVQFDWPQRALAEGTLAGSISDYGWVKDGGSIGEAVSVNGSRVCCFPDLVLVRKAVKATVPAPVPPPEPSPTKAEETP